MAYNEISRMDMWDIIRRWHNRHAISQIAPALGYDRKTVRSYIHLPQWKLASVHPDHYIQFQGKAYSVPHAYVGRQVWIRATERILQVYHQEQLIKQHVITRHYRHTDFNDFPATSSMPSTAARSIARCSNGPNRSDQSSTM